MVSDLWLLYADAGHDIIGKENDSAWMLAVLPLQSVLRQHLDGVSDIDIFQLKASTEEFDRALAFADRVREHTSCNIQHL